MRRFPRKIVLIAVATLVVVSAALLWIYRWQAIYVALPHLVRPDLPFDAKPAPAAPDYAEVSAWLARPGAGPANDGAINDGAIAGPDAAVFFVHPTTWLKGESWNQPPEAFSGDRVLHRTIVPNQLSAFESCCALWAPHYRQATFYAFLTAGDDGRKALERAYGDVARAFDVFLAATEPAPFVLAAHSQGSLHAMRLLRERIAGTPAADRLAAAYLPGYPFPADAGSPVPLCGIVGSGCLASWNAVERGAPTTRLFEQAWQPADGSYDRAAIGEAICVNPLSWRADGAPVPAADNPGSYRAGFVDGALEQPAIPLDPAIPFDPAIPLDPAVTGAHCDRRGILRITRPAIEAYRKAPLGPGWRHVQEYALFWESIRRDAVRRVEAVGPELDDPALPCRACG